MRSSSFVVFALRRLLQMIPLLLAVIVINFVLMELAPGDPIRALLGRGGEYVDPELEAKYREKYGLDQAAPIRLVKYIKEVATGNLGISFFYKVPVRQLIAERLPNTLVLLVPALALGVLGGILLGIVASLRAHSLLDNLATTFALLTYAMPLFWYGVMVVGIVAVRLRLLPPGGMYDMRAAHTGFDRTKDLAVHLILPVSVLSLRRFAQIQRLTRANMLEVLKQDYITTARAKGLSERLVFYRHALRNVMLPVVTVVGMSAGYILTGSVITETIFDWPGLGRLLFEGITRRDYPVMLGMLVVVTVGMMLANFATDLAYGFLDPRVRYD